MGMDEALGEQRQAGSARARPPALGGQFRAALGAAIGQNTAAGLGGHARTEPVPAFPDQAAWLKSAFHGSLLQRYLGLHP